MRKKQKYIQHEKTLYAICKGVMLLWATAPPPPPLPPNISQSSLKTPHPDDPPPRHPTPPQTYPLIHTQNITKHDYVTKPVSLGKRWSTAKLPPDPLPPPCPPCLLPLQSSERGDRVLVQSVHSSVSGLYTSIVLRNSFPSKPPTA